MKEINFDELKNAEFNFNKFINELTNKVRIEMTKVLENDEKYKEIINNLKVCNLSEEILFNILIDAKNFKFPKITEVINIDNLDELSIKYGKIVYQKIIELYLENEEDIHKGIYNKFFKILNKIVEREKTKLNAELNELKAKLEEQEKKKKEKEQQAKEKKKVKEEKQAKEEQQAKEEKKVKEENQAKEEQQTKEELKKESSDNKRATKNDEDNVSEQSNKQKNQSNPENKENVVENDSETFKNQKAQQEVKSDEKAEKETIEKSKKTDAEIGENADNNQVQKSNENGESSYQNVKKEFGHNLFDEIKQGEAQINGEKNINNEKGQNNKTIQSEDTQAKSSIKEEKNSQISSEDIENNETVEDDNLDIKELGEMKEKIDDLTKRNSIIEKSKEIAKEAENPSKMNELKEDKSNPLIKEAIEATFVVENSNSNQVIEKMGDIKEYIFQQFMQEPSKNISNAYENKADEDINLFTKLMNQDGNAFSKKKNKEYEYSNFDFIIIGNSIVKENKKNLSCKYIFLNYDDLKGEENIFLGNYKKDNIFITFIYIKDKNILLYLECSGKSDKEVKDDKIDDGFKEKFIIKDYELKKNIQFENLSEDKKDEIICLNVLEYFLKLEEGEKRDNFINKFESQNFKEIINENKNKNNITSNNPKYYTIECYNMIKNNEKRTIKEVNIQEVYFIIYPKKIEKIQLELTSGNICEDYIIGFKYREKNIALKNLKEIRKYLEEKLTNLEKKDWDTYLEKLKENIEKLEDEENEEDE